MTTSALERLRRADPAAELDQPASEALLEQLTSRPRPATRPHGRAATRRTVAIGALAAGALAAAAVLGGGSSDAPGPSLLSKAYAQATAEEESIQYSRITGRQEVTTSSGTRIDDVSRMESWVFGDRVRTIITSEQRGKTFMSEQVLGSDGVLTIRLKPGAEEQVVRPGNDEEAREVLADMRRGFLKSFTDAYRRGALDERGPTTFAGRSAQRYVVERGALDEPQTFYVDARTGTPLGSTASFPSYTGSAIEAGPDGKPRGRGEPNSRTTITTTVEALEALPPTRENLARLTR